MSAISPSTGNLSILKGNVYFRSSSSSPWRHLGNAPAFDITPKVDVIEHNTAMSGVKSIDARIPTFKGAEIKITLDETSGYNLAIALFGDHSDFTQTAVTAGTTKTFTDVAVGDTYELGVTDVTVATVTDETTPTPVAYTLNTHYRVDAASGLITILAKPAQAGDDVVVTYGASAVVAGDQRSKIKMLKSLAVLEGGFMCAGSNDQGNKFLVKVTKVSLTPSGAIGFISEEIAKIELTGTVLYDSSVPDAPYGTVIEL